MLHALNIDAAMSVPAGTEMSQRARDDGRKVLLKMVMDACQ